MKLFRWQKGRIDTGYEIFPIIWSRKLGIDLLISRCPKHSYIPEHIDKCEDRKHYRFTMLLKPAKVGGKFRIKGQYKGWWIFKVFRADLYVHEVTKVNQGTRYALLAGWLKK